MPAASPCGHGAPRAATTIRNTVSCRPRSPEPPAISSSPTIAFALVVNRAKATAACAEATSRADEPATSRLHGKGVARLALQPRHACGTGALDPWRVAEQFRVAAREMRGGGETAGHRDLQDRHRGLQ